MKKSVMILILVLLLVCGTGSLWAQGKQEASSGNYLIGGVMYDLSNKFHTYLEEGITRFASMHEDVDVVITDCKADANLQINQVENLISKGVDAIVLTPVEPSTLPMIIAKCQSADIKLVIVNLLPNEEDIPNIDAYVGSESIDAGIMQAQWVAEALGGTGNVGILIGDLGLEVARMRTQGNKDVFAQYEGISVVREAEGKWDRARGMSIVENWLQADIDKELDAIVCNNDEMAIGASFAAKQIGREDLVIAGIDATPDALELLGSDLDVTVFQSGYGQGFGGAEAAYKLLTGQAVEKMNWIPFEIVTPDLREEYLSKWE